MTYQYTKPRTVLVEGWYPVTYIAEQKEVHNWASPRRPDGSLALRANPHLRTERKIFGVAIHNVSGGQNFPLTASLPTVWIEPADWTSSENRAYARFRGKLYRGAGALGVTLGSLKQSREMIEARYKTFTQQADKALGRLTTLSGRRGGNRSLHAAGSLYLEYLFGWVPLYQDIYAACNSVIQDADYLTYVRASSGVNSRLISDSNTWAGYRTTGDGLVSWRVVYASGVRVDNPNRWLLERAGLLNPLTVAWDLVPWSFVVNWFVNVNSLVQQITDFAGLSFDNQSVTRWCAQHQTGRRVRLSDGLEEWRQTQFCARKERTVGQIPRPQLELRLPEVNWDLAAIAASLASQKLGALSRFAPRGGRFS